jgi:hypothetical protein
VPSAEKPQRPCHVEEADQRTPKRVYQTHNQGADPAAITHPFDGDPAHFTVIQSESCAGLESPEGEGESSAAPAAVRRREIEIVRIADPTTNAQNTPWGRGLKTDSFSTPHPA